MRLAAVLAVTFSLLGSAGAAPAKVSLTEARKIALARVPGTVIKEKLKHKKKGHDHYNIKIAPRDHAHKGQLRKVEVDADTGQILKIKDVAAKDAKDAGTSADD